MTKELLITLICAIVAIVGFCITLITALRSGSLKQFIIEKMEEAEKTGKSAEMKLQYVIDAVKEKYKVLALIINIKKIVEILISFSKQVNFKK